jgi:ADP-ribosyl-[dinitrogen reductase] hydrolase
MMPMISNSSADRCRGVLDGLAAGDRNGGPIRMAVRHAESLLDCGGFNSADILNRYLAWWREGAFDTGPVSGRALALVAAGVPAPEATLQVHWEFGGKTAGCNPAHRSPPLSMLASMADDDLGGCAMAEARLTHHDPLAGEVAAAVNKLCQALIRGAAWQDAVQEAGSFAGQKGPGTNGGYAPDVLRAALFFVGKSASFTEALDRSLASAGPSNYCPVLVGAVAGARWGASAIPPSALAHVDIFPRVRAAAEALAAGWTARTCDPPFRVRWKKGENPPAKTRASTTRFGNAGHGQKASDLEDLVPARYAGQ